MPALDVSGAEQAKNARLMRAFECLQDLKTLVVESLNPLSPEVISRQATINIGKPACSLTQLQHTAAGTWKHGFLQATGRSDGQSSVQNSSARQRAPVLLGTSSRRAHLQRW
jgi:hypothetical protein